MEIKIASRADREAIINIWTRCFTEELDYISTFLDHCFPHTTTLLLGKNGDYFSVLSLIPSYFIKDGNTFEGSYLYGVGTLPQHRGNSYSSILINYAINLLKEQGKKYFIVKPATESLFSLYKKLGFNNELFSYKYNTPSETPPLSKVIIESPATNINTIYRDREHRFKDNYFLWPKPILKYAIIEALTRDGFLFHNNSTQDYCIGYPISKEELVILETTTNIPNLNTLFGDLIKSRYPYTKEWVIHSPTPPYRDSSPNLYALLMELEPGISSISNNLTLSLPME